MQQQVIREASRVMGSKSGELVQNILSATYNSDSGTLATVASIFVLFFGATNIFYQLKTTLNRIFEVDGDAENQLLQGLINFLKGRLIASLMVIGVGFFLLFSQIFSATLSVIISLARDLPLNSSLLLNLLNLLLSLSFSTMVFAFIFRFVPDKQLSWRFTWIGALFTSLLFAIGQNILRFYFQNSDIASAYGVAGSLIVILLWMYFSANVILFGAEFMLAYANISNEQHEKNKKPSENRSSANHPRQQAT